jgi:AcrR family transcriptional regulator
MPVASREPSRLTLDTIVDAAVELIDADGFAALSMRKLADRCGVATMTLYGHFATKDELVAALGDRFFGEIELPAADLGWEEQVKAIFRAVHGVFLRHPELAEIVARQHLNAMSAFRGAEITLAALRRAGLDERDAVSAFITLTSYTTGFSQRQHVDSAPAAPTLQARRLARLRSLPAEEFGHLPELATVFVAGLTDRHFEDGLDLLVRGIASRAEETT